MKFMKAFGKIYDIKLNKAEQAALDKEIFSQLDEYIDRCSDDIMAEILWQLHEEFGFGEKRLRRFYDTLEPRLHELTKYYELKDSDRGFLCRYKLRGMGIDISDWKNDGGTEND